MQSNGSAEPKRLTGRKGDYKFEMWVEIEGKPLEIYAVTQGVDGTPEASSCANMLILDPS
jgi:hypothetical protein